MLIRHTLALTVLTLTLPAHAGLQELKWLAGCWMQDGREPGSVEQWTAPAGGTMLGMSRIISNGKTVAFEYLRIVAGDDGGIALIASPSGQETARFEMIILSSNEVVFENLEHDFPQRIIYRLIDNRSLLGRIEGIKNGRERAADFPMTRITCGHVDEPE